MNFLVVSVFRSVPVEDQENEKEDTNSNLYPLNECCLKSLMTNSQICCDGYDANLTFDQIVDGFCCHQKFQLESTWEDVNLTREYVKLMPVATVSKTKTEMAAGSTV